MSLQSFREKFRSYHFTIFAVLDIAKVIGIGILAVAVVIIFFNFAGFFHLIDYSTVVSLIVVEVPLSLILYFLLGERRRSTLSETIDRIEIAEKYGHLKLHYWNLLWKFSKYWVVENTSTHTAYDAPTYLLDWGRLGMIEEFHHTNERVMREHFARQNPVVTVINRDATPRDLLLLPNH